MKKKCPYCGSDKFVKLWFDSESDYSEGSCSLCGEGGTAYDFMDRSLFGAITESPEVLAEDLVYSYGAMWESTIIVDTTFDTYEEAYAATVAKLKEIKK